MPQLLLVRLVPNEPTSGGGFADHLEGLTITALELSLHDPRGVPIGQAFRDPDPAENDIIQHAVRDADGGPIPVPVATAFLAIDVPAGRLEHGSVDVILVVERNETLIERSVHYDVPVLDADEPEVRSGPIAAYVSLPGPGVGIDLDEPHIELPQDGTPPPFARLRAAVEAVLAHDRRAGVELELAALTPAQCHHIARQLLTRRGRRPLPSPPRRLRELYAPSDSPSIATDRERFEAELRTHHGTLEAEASWLGRHIFALSAAIEGEDRSDRADRVVLPFPVRPGARDTAAPIPQAEVVLTR